ncbi:hypothetical protein HMPREF3208_00295 [Gardnerella vaginalis]|uniref:Uncharacterized protein n=1 Tax=Gardnerella vaginalis TaxID=2702 RepID=A0A133P1J2_GARVA|nr:hypothetical protein HMPREF3208_00295 [Gardnerella vaginalis]
MVVEGIDGIEFGVRCAAAELNSQNMLCATLQRIALLTKSDCVTVKW